MSLLAKFCQKTRADTIHGLLFLKYLLANFFKSLFTAGKEFPIQNAEDHQILIDTVRKDGLADQALALQALRFIDMECPGVIILAVQPGPMEFQIIKTIVRIVKIENDRFSQ